MPHNAIYEKGKAGKGEEFQKPHPIWAGLIVTRFWAGQEKVSTIAQYVRRKREGVSASTQRMGGEKRELQKPRHISAGKAKIVRNYAPRGREMEELRRPRPT